MAPAWLIDSLLFLAALFIFVIGSVLLLAAIVFVRDLFSKDAVVRNYPVIGHFRYIFMELGKFFRAYFFSMDREELPFNRAERGWVKRSARKMPNIIGFGSTKVLTNPGTSIFVNCPFPVLEKNRADTKPLRIGPYCEKPYDAPSFFNISGMSFGAISKPAVRALSKGAQMAGCWLNTGEGGLASYHEEGGADVVFQIGTGKFGVRDEGGNFCEEKLKELAAKDHIKMFEIKLSQGAKPGKGGVLPAKKVTAEIAEIRGIRQGESAISPNRHVEIDNPADLLDFIEKVRSLSGKPVGFKTAIGDYDWLESLFKEVHKRGIESAPDFITIDSGDGGSGAAPMPLMDNVALRIKEALPPIADLLKAYDMRGRTRLIVSGKLITPSEVAWALCAGADFVTSARGFMFALGCIQAMRCHQNTCPTGVTTHNKRLQRGLDPKDKAVKVANYCTQLRYDVEMIAHACGVDEPRKLTRKHMRIVQNTGHSVRMDTLYPEPKVKVTFEGDETSA